MKEKIENLLNDKLRTKKELIEYLKMSEGGFYSKMKNETWKRKDIDKLATFFDVKPEVFLGVDSNIPPKNDQYLHDYLRKIEQEWKSVVDEKNKTIEQQQFMLSMMRDQLSAALGKEWHSEEMLPVRRLDSLKLKPLVPVIIGQAV